MYQSEASRTAVTTARKPESTRSSGRNMKSPGVSKCLVHITSHFLFQSWGLYFFFFSPLWLNAALRRALREQQQRYVAFMYFLQIKVFTLIFELSRGLGNHARKKLNKKIKKK